MLRSSVQLRVRAFTFTEEKSDRAGDSGVAERDQERECWRESVQATDGSFQTMIQAPATTGSQKGGRKVLPAPQRTCNDCSLPEVMGEAVLKFLQETRVGEAKAGAVCR